RGASRSAAAREFVARLRPVVGAAATAASRPATCRTMQP
ncbi:LysR family transcriptional regulator, partial [Paracidovorax avenae]